MRSLIAAALLLLSSAASAQTITAVFPGSGRPGDLVHITGKGLLNSAAACAPLGCGAHVTIGGVDAAKVSITDTEVVVVAPEHAPGAADVTFTSAGFPPSTLAGAYTFEYASADDYERMLIPVAGSTPGVFGSQWQTSVSAYSEKSMSLRVPYCPPGGVVCGVDYVLAAGKPSAFGVNGTSRGAFMYVPRQFANDADFVVHVVGSAHPNESNTHVPVVRARDFRSSVRLLDIPLAPAVRAMLRVYGYNAGTVTVTARGTAGQIVGTRQLELQGGSTDVDFPMYPWTVSIRPEDLPVFGPQYVVNLEITSNIGLPLWAFVSLTNNETQHINLIVPFRKD